MIKFKRLFKTALLATSLVIPVTMLQADATTGDITVDYYWVNLAANGNPDDTYELTLSRYNANTRLGLDGVNGTDDRYVDTNSSVVRIRTTFSAMPYSTGTRVPKASSGFIVGSHVIATSAHCMDSYPEGIERIENSKVYVTDPETNEVLEFTVQQVHIPSLYMSTGSTDYDYALLTVAEDLTEYGMFSLGYIRDEVLDNRGITVTVSGYPAQVLDSNGNVINVGNTLYTGKGALLEVRENMLFYRTDATEGDSGGPAYVTTISTIQGNSPVTANTVIGIHHGREDIDKTNGTSSDNENVATRITEPVLQFYNNNPNIGY